MLDFIEDFFATFNNLELDGIDLTTEESAKKSLEILKQKQIALQAKMRNVEVLKKLIQQ